MITDRSKKVIDWAKKVFTEESTLLRVRARERTAWDDALADLSSPTFRDDLLVLSNGEDESWQCDSNEEIELLCWDLICGATARSDHELDYKDEEI